MFSLLTGLRKGDLESKITWGDLKKDEKGWHIYIAMTKGGKKDSNCFNSPSYEFTRRKKT